MAAPQYATLADLTAQLDEQYLKMLSSDTGADGALDLTTNLKLKGALERASSDIEAHALRGQRYSAEDLVALFTARDMTLIGLACTLTQYNLAVRRGGDLPPAVDRQHGDDNRMLKALADGELIFGKSTAAAEAGVIKATVISPTLRQSMGLPSDSAFFPPAQDRLW